MAENTENVQATNTSESNIEAVSGTTSQATDNTANANAEIAKLKVQLSKANSEAANFKRQLREKMSADEQAEADRKAANEAIENELKELRRGKAVGEYKAKYLSLGFDEQMATETAEAMIDGDTEKVFCNLKALTANIKKSAVGEAMTKQSGISVGKAPGIMEQDKLDSMSDAEYYAYIKNKK